VTTVTIEVPDEVRSLIDEARGDQDMAAYLLTAAARQARRKLARRSSDEVNSQSGDYTFQYTTRGRLRSINLAQRSCQVYIEKKLFVTCCFDQSLEEQVKAALDCFVEVTGEAVLPAGAEELRVREMKLQEVKIIEPQPGEDGFTSISVSDFLASEFVGAWKDRTDIDDTDEFANKLRNGLMEES
jgi:hypothetical protein